MENREQYGRCLVFAGGGFRFAYYLGVHAAAEECGRAPDVLLASCGRAIAAAVIAGLPDRDARLQWVESSAMYGFLRAIRPGDRATPLRALGGAFGRWVDRRPAVRIPDLFHDYLFDLPAALPLPSTTRVWSAVRVSCFPRSFSVQNARPCCWMEVRRRPPIRAGATAR